MTEGKIQKLLRRHHRWKPKMTDQQLIDHCYQRFIDLCKLLDQACIEFPVWFVDVKGEKLIMGAREMYDWFVEYFGSGMEDESERKD